MYTSTCLGMRAWRTMRAREASWTHTLCRWAGAVFSGCAVACVRQILRRRHLDCVLQSGRVCRRHRQLLVPQRCGCDFAEQKLSCAALAVVGTRSDHCTTLQNFYDVVWCPACIPPTFIRYMCLGGHVPHESRGYASRTPQHIIYGDWPALPSLAFQPVYAAFS